MSDRRPRGRLRRDVRREPPRSLLLSVCSLTHDVSIGARR